MTGNRCSHRQGKDLDRKDGLPHLYPDSLPFDNDCLHLKIDSCRNASSKHNEYKQVFQKTTCRCRQRFESRKICHWTYRSSICAICWIRCWQIDTECMSFPLPNLQSAELWTNNRNSSPYFPYSIIRAVNRLKATQSPQQACGTLGNFEWNIHDINSFLRTFTK